MIAVARDPSTEPTGFSQRRARWEEELLEAYRRDGATFSVSKAWSKIRPQLRSDAEILFAIFHGKCAFCESKAAHVSNLQIEHYLPKSDALYRDRVFDWSNWLASCGRCNQSKWAHVPLCDGRPCLVDPTNDDPAEHIDFEDAYPIGLTSRGEETVDLVDLARSPLLEERARWLLWIQTLLLLCTLDDARPRAREVLLWSMQPEAPYTAMTRRFIRARAPRLAAPHQPHPHVRLERPVELIRKLIEQYQPFLNTLE